MADNLAMDTYDSFIKSPLKPQGRNFGKLEWSTETPAGTVRRFELNNMHMDRAEGDIVPGMMFQVSNGTFLVPNRRSTVYDDRAGLRLQIDNYRMWVPELDLTFLDKYQIRLDCWLTNKHINACHHMLRRQFPAYIGFQDSRLSNYEHGFDNISYHYYNAIQIHHLPSGSHWITTQFKRGKVFLYDSSYTGHISSDLQMQVQNIYGDRDIHQVHVHQQEGRNNCGVLAIAFALHAARGDLIETIRFDEEKMRYHLMQCFEEQFFRPFPTLQKQDDKVRPSLIKPNQIQRDQRVKMATPTPVSLYAWLLQETVGNETAEAMETDD